MKKLLVVLLSLGLIVAFSTAASAVDLKFSGSYYLTGVYDANDMLRDNGKYDSAVFYQQVRVQTVFQVAEGLSMTTRFDALEKQWGQIDQYGGMTGGSYQDKGNSRKSRAMATGNPALQENLEFEQGYMTMKTAIGQFDVGYQTADMWGTLFMDSGMTRPRIKYAMPIGPMTLIAIYEKVFEAQSTIGLPGYLGKSDADWDNYMLAGVFKFKGGEAGLLYKYVYNAFGTVSTAPAPAFKTKIHAFIPYMKATFGPVYVEGELGYAFGKAAEFQTAGYTDVDQKGLSAYMLARLNLGPAYFGGQVGYVQGDGDNKTERTTGPEAGYSWTPTLMLQNIALFTYKYGYGNNSNDPYHRDSRGYFLYQVFGGFNPTPKLNMEASVSVASFDTKKTWDALRTKQTEIADNKLGTEIDLQATYKIFDNLSYMVGAAYLITGDAYKGTNNNSGFGIGNDFMLLNKLTLTF